MPSDVDQTLWNLKLGMGQGCLGLVGRHKQGMLTAAKAGASPRAIRLRAARFAALAGMNPQTSNRAAKRPPSPHQEQVMSKAGRSALGPWLGPFATHPKAEGEVELPATVYADNRGTAHLSLDPKVDMKQTSAGAQMQPSKQQLALAMAGIPNRDKCPRSMYKMGKDNMANMSRGARARKMFQRVNQPVKRS